MTANAIVESPRLRQQMRAVFVIDGTDAELLRNTRESPENLGRYRQMSIQEALASFTGVSRWTPHKVESDVNYRSTVQRSFLTTSTSPRTMIAAHREYMNEPLSGQAAMASHDFDRYVIAAGDNKIQQQELARRTDSTFSFVGGSNHRSIIGKTTFATTVARTVREALL